MTIRSCLRAQLAGLAPCDALTPDAELCDPCARRRLIGLRAADRIEDAYLAGYAQAWADADARRPFGDLDGLADFLRAAPLD